MKTKHILTAMALPAMLAACTADEIVENNNVGVKRAEVSAVSFTTEGLSSRLAFNEETLDWKWESTDKFLLLQADGGYYDTTEDALPGDRFSAGAPSTGYQYEKTENGYETKAAVMEEGLYWGYAPSFNKTYKGNVKFELPTAQYMGVKGKKDTYSNAELVALITPLYEVSALNEGEFYNNLPLEMINFFTTLEIPLKNNTEEDITINQIVFESDTELTVKGRVNTQELADFIIASDGEEWAPAANFDEDDENDKTMAEFLDDMRKEKLICAYDKEAGDKQSKTIVLNLDGYVLKPGKSAEFYMLVPATNQVAIDYSIAIVAEEGLVEIKSSDVSNAMEDTKIFHNSKKAAFGRTNKNVARSFVIDEDDFTKMHGAYYVTSYEDLETILDEDVNGTISVYNVGEWGIDANLAKAIKNSDAFVIFKNDITVEGAALTAEKALELEKMAFEGIVTVIKDTKVDFKLDQYVPAVVVTRAVTKVDAKVNGLEVSKGAEVTLSKGAYKDITNKGTLTIVKGIVQQPNAAVTNTGTLNLKGEDIKTVLNGGSLNYIALGTTADKVFTASYNNITFASELEDGDLNIKVGSNVVWAVSGGANNAATPVGYNDDDEAVYFTNIENNGTIRLAGYLKPSGMFTNANNAVVEGDYCLYILNEAENNGLIKSQIEIVKDAVMTNNNEIAESTWAYNYGTIIAGEDSYTNINGGNGRIDNTNEGRIYVEDGHTQTIFYQFSGNVEELEKINFDRLGMAVNTLQINGALTLDEPFSTENKLANLKKLELANNAKVNVDAKVGVTFDVIEVLDNASVEFKGYNAQDTYIDMYANTAVNVQIKLGKASTLKVTNVALGAITAQNATTIAFVKPTLTDDDKSTSTTEPWYAAAAKVENVKSDIQVTLNAADYSTTKEGTSIAKSIYWVGAVAANN